MPSQRVNESSWDSGIGIALLYLTKSQDQGVQLVPPPTAQINWEPAHLKLLYRSDQSEFLWKTSEPDIGTSKLFSEHAIRRYQESERRFSVSPLTKNFNTAG
jgi:hypothetical protein